jgi:hypothetical protein
VDDVSVERVVGPKPHVLIVGGYLTEPFNYAPLRRRLLARGAASVTICPVHLPDWVGAAFVGFGPLLLRTGLAIRRARRCAGGPPVIVVAHSAGGILTRLAMSPVAFRGRYVGAADDVGALVTLGTPHRLTELPSRIARAGFEAVGFVERHTPGAWFSPRTGYLSVGSDFVGPVAVTHVHWWDRARGWAFRSIVGVTPPEGGDGIVPVTSVHLDGARQLTFHDVRHGHIGGPWYADDAVVDRWWPRAVAIWRAAIQARAALALDDPEHRPALSGDVDLAPRVLPE